MLPIIRVRGSAVSFIRKNLPQDLLGLVQLATRAAEMIRQRVHIDGLAGDGRPWSDYKAVRKQPGRGDRFYWTGVGEPQPEAGRLSVARRGKYAGRAAYPSYLAWRRAMGLTGNQKLFVASGQMKDAFEVVSPRPTIATVQYNKMTRTGMPAERSNWPNSLIARFAFRSERMSPMQLSAAELREVQELAAVAFESAALEQLQLAETEMRSTRARKRLSRAASKVGVAVR